MKVKTKELSGHMLNYAVEMSIADESVLDMVQYHDFTDYENDLDAFNRLMEDKHIHVGSAGALGHGYQAVMWEQPLSVTQGNKAVCIFRANTREHCGLQCLVQSQYGDEIDIPDYVLKEHEISSEQRSSIKGVRP